MENASKMEKKTRMRACIQPDLQLPLPEANDIKDEKSKRKKSKSSSQSKAINTQLGTQQDPDITSDFSSGWTPYKKVAKAVTTKQQSQGLSKKRKQPKAEKPERNEIIPTEDASAASLLTATAVVMLRREPVPSCSSSVNLSRIKQEGKVCIACGVIVNRDDHSSHVKMCLKMKFQRDRKNEANGGARGAGPRPARSRYVLCQICQQDISEMSTGDQQRHVNDCLDGKNIVATGATKDKRADARDVVEATHQEYRCQICGKVLTKMDTQRRLQHINKCIDMAKPDEDQTNEANRRNRNTDRQKPKRSTRNKKGPVRNTRADSERVKRLEEPTSKLDEETQLALALSESMRNDNKADTNDTEIGTSLLMEHDKDEKDAFSILMSQKPQQKAPKKRKGKNSVPLPAPKLVTTTEEERARTLEEKIATLLPSQESTDITSTPSFPKTRTREPCGSDEPSTLWVADTADIIGKVITNKFYVEKLPQVVPSTVKAGSKIKKMGYIPGWKPINELPTNVEQLSSGSFETSNNETMLASTQTAVLLAELADDINSTVRPSDSSASQTDFCQQSMLNRTSKHNKTVHFHMSDDDGNLTSSMSSKNPPQLTDDNTAVLRNLSSDLEKLVDDPMGSDFTILCKDDVIVPAYSILIRVRCPALFEASSNSRLSLPSCSKECVKSLLSYIYAGNVDVPVELIPEVKSLAEMFDLQSLEKSCMEIRCRHATKLDATLSSLHESPAPMSHELIDKTLQNFLSEVWSSDSDSESSNIDSEGRENAGATKAETDQLEMDELYKFVASQRGDNSQDQSRSTDGIPTESGSSDEDSVHRSNSNSKGIEHTCIDVALMQKLEESFMVYSNDKPMSTEEPVDSDQDSLASSVANTDLAIGCPVDTDFGETSPTKQVESSVMPSSLDHVLCSPDSPVPVYSIVDTEGMEIDSSVEDLTYKDLQSAPLAGEVTESEAHESMTEGAEDRSQNIDTARSRTPSPVVENHSSHIERTPDLFGTPDDGDDMCARISQNSIRSRKSLRKSYDQFNSCITSPVDDLFDFSLASENDNGDLNLMRDDCDEACTVNVPIEAVGSDRFVVPEDRNMQGCRSPQSNDGENDIQITGEIKGFRRRIGDYGSPVISQKLPAKTKSHERKSSRHVENSSRNFCRSPSLLNLSEFQSKMTPPKTGMKRCRSPTFLSDDLENSPKRSKYNSWSNRGPCPQKSSQYQHKSKSSIQPSYRKSNAEDSRSSGHDGSGSDCVVNLTSEEIDDTLPELDGGETNNDAILDNNSHPIAFKSKNKFIDLRQTDALTYNQDQRPQGADEHQDLGEGSGQEEGSADVGNGTDQLIEQEQSTSVCCDMDNKEEEQSDYDPDDVWEGYDEIEAACVENLLPSSPEDAGVLHFSMSPAPKEGSQKSICDDKQVNKSTSETVSPIHWKTPDEVLKHPDVLRLTPSTSRHHKSSPRGRMQSDVNERSFGEFDPPTDMESDVSMALKDANDSILWSNENVPEPETVGKAPAIVPDAVTAKPKKKRSNKKWVPPSPFTPLPNYAEMITPDLKKNCQKVGVRALPKKKMIVLMNDVFKRTHEYETDSDYDGSPPPRAPEDHQVSPEVRRPSKSSRAPRGRSGCRGRTKKDTNIALNDATRKRTEKKAAPNTDSREDVPGNSQDLGSSSCSQESTSVPDLPEESMIIQEDGEKNTKVSKRDVAYKKQCIWDFIKAHPEIYISMLHYETLDFTSFHQQLKDSGLTYGVAIVMEFLDEQNIQFTLKNQQARQRRQKKPKDRKTTKKVSSSQSQRK